MRSGEAIDMNKRSFLGAASGFLVCVTWPYAIEAQTTICSTGAANQPAAVASQLLASLKGAYARLQADYGADIFIKRVGEVTTPRGMRTIGDVWGEYLGKAGFPEQLAERQRCTMLLGPAGLSDTAMTILVMMPANYDAYEDLSAGLGKIAAGASNK
jgi:hypothetical protein